MLTCGARSRVTSCLVSFTTCSSPNDASARITNRLDRVPAVSRVTPCSAVHECTVTNPAGRLGMLNPCSGVKKQICPPSKLVSSTSSSCAISRIGQWTLSRSSGPTSRWKQMAPGAGPLVHLNTMDFAAVSSMSPSRSGSAVLLYVEDLCLSKYSSSLMASNSVICILRSWRSGMLSAFSRHAAAIRPRQRLR